MSGRSALWLVAAREIRQALRGKAFWIVGGLLLLASAAGMIVPELLGDDDTPTYEVTVVDASDSLAAALEQAAGAIGGEVVVSEASDEAAARAQVDDDEADVAVVLGAEPVIFVKAGQNDRLMGAVRQALVTDALATGMIDAGVSEAEATAVLEGPSVRVEELDTQGAARRGAAFILALAMYLLLLMLMMSVANGTAVEKSNRISEVLLAIVRPGALLFGKVLGVGIIGLLTLACGVAPMVVKMAVGGDLPEGIGGALAGGAAWFVLGTALYLVLAGALGAMVERQEEAGTVVAPLSVLLVVAYLVGGSAPETLPAQVLAYIPLTSPMAMPPRIAVGAASGMEMAVSLVLSLLAVVLVARVGATVYQRAIVRTGRRLKLAEVLRRP